MTDVLRKVLGALPRQVDAPSGAPAADPPPAPTVRVEVRLSDELRERCALDVTPLLGRHLSGMVDELGLDAAVQVRDLGRTLGPASATVSADGRPVALLDRGLVPAEDAIDGLLSEAMRRLTRRLPLLAGGDGDERRAAPYLTSIGCRLPNGMDLSAAGTDTAEELVDLRTAERVVLEVAAATMREADEDAVRAMARFREAEYATFGISYPDVHVTLTDGRPGSVRLRLNDLTLPPRHLGEDAGWTDVVEHLGSELRARRHWFVRMRHIKDVVDDDLAYFLPYLVTVSRQNYPTSVVTACVRELVRSGWRMRNVPRILWLMLEQGGSPAGSDILRLSEAPLQSKARHRPRVERDLNLLALRVRKLADEESWRLGTYRPAAHPARLPAAVEERLVADRPGPDRADAEWSAVRAVAAAPETDLVVTRTVDAIAPVRAALQAVESVPRVVTSHELPPDADLSALPILTDPDARA